MPKLFNKRNFAHIYSVAKVSTNKMEKIHYLKSVLLENKNYCIWNDSEIKSTGNRSYLGLLKIISCVYIMVDPGITQVVKYALYINMLQPLYINVFCSLKSTGHQNYLQSHDAWGARQTKLRVHLWESRSIYPTP